MESIIDTAKKELPQNGPYPFQDSWARALSTGPKPRPTTSITELAQL